jgi:chromate transporter
MHSPNKQNGLLGLFLVYLRLGCLSFGGPVAHMAYFRDEFVHRRAWLSDERYAELLGLCQFVPGPSSSQLGFAIGWHRSGLRGACIAWLGFTLPSALIMVACAYGLFALAGDLDSAIRGLLIAAVAVVAKATLGLGSKLCPDPARLAIALLAAVLVLMLPGSAIQIAAIGLGALIAQVLPSDPDRQRTTPKHRSYRLKPLIVFGALTVYALLLGISLCIEPSTPGALYALHYRAGALVFGGGHVVLPLLNDSIVTNGFVSEAHFLAGYSSAQALPGPLFTLSAFLGTIGGGTQPAAVGGLLALVAIFLPGLLLLVGLLPFWERIRNLSWAQAALRGANAAVVGLLLAAFINPVWVHGIRSPADFGSALLAFCALQFFKAPAWAVVLSCGALGYLFY